MNTERVTKTRTGENPRNVREVAARAYALSDNADRCPIVTWKKYCDLRPEGFSKEDDPFYLAILKKNPQRSDQLFKRQPVGKNKLSTFMQAMVSLTSSIPAGRKLTNTSVRKQLASKLNDSFIPKDVARHITGHKNTRSLDSYDAISKKQQLLICNIFGKDGTDTASLKSTLPSYPNAAQSQIETAQQVIQYQVVTTQVMQQPQSVTSPIIQQSQMMTTHMQQTTHLLADVEGAATNDAATKDDDAAAEYAATDD